MTNKAIIAYRNIIRAARGMPSRTQRDYILLAARKQFEKGRYIIKEDDVKQALSIAEFQIETINVQAGAYKSKYDHFDLTESVEEKIEEGSKVYGTKSSLRLLIIILIYIYVYIMHTSSLLFFLYVIRSFHSLYIFTKET